MSVAGVILAAGEGRRFGSTKQLAELDGVPLLVHCLRTMSDFPVLDPLIVVLGADSQRIMSSVIFGRARPVVCPDWREGMAASLRAGVEAAQDCSWALVALGDQPRLSATAIAEVIQATREARPDERAVRASYGGVPSHPVALSRAMFSEVARLRGDEGARVLLTQVKVRVVELDERSLPADVDTGADLRRLRAETRIG